MPRLHLFRIEDATSEDVYNNVYDVIVADGSERKECVLGTTVDAVNECFKPMTWLPVSCHVFFIGMTIVGCAALLPYGSRKCWKTS